MHHHHHHHNFHHHMHHMSHVQPGTPSSPRAMIVSAAVMSLISVIFCTVFIAIALSMGLNSSFPIYFFLPFFIVPVLIIAGSIWNLVRTIRIAKAMEKNGATSPAESPVEPPHEFANEGQDHRFDYDHDDGLEVRERSPEEKAEDPIVCRKCGFINPPGSKVCNQCAANLDEQ